MTRKLGYGDVPEGFDRYENAKIVMVPVPYDGTSTWLKGADKGPAAIIEASRNMYLYDIETDSEVYTWGIFTDEAVREKKTPGTMVDAVKARVATHLVSNKFVVTLGGEHSVSIGSVRAHAEAYRNLSVLQLDAHADLQQEFNGSRYNHACVMARVREVCPVVQVGIRSMDSGEMAAVDPERLFFAERIRGDPDWMERAASLLTDRVYVTIDVDAFDISIMPATGTPEPGGLLWYDVLEFLRRITEDRQVVGFDVVELCPNRYSKHCDFLAAKLVYKLLSYIFTKR
ncbi:MAG: agmatinase [Spirochaetes bacterium RBG_13_51_14]|nr:MAG: agmatinase [Spirochaetes bacterium RBG_13_51_14]